MKNKVRKILMIFSCLIGLSFTLSAQNPYLPLWEFIPDGEPYVFEDPDCPASTVSIFMARTIISSGCIADVTKWCGRHP